MQTVTFEEFKNIQKEQNYKSVGFYNFVGDCLINPNNNRVSPDKKIEEIERMLKAPACEDGIYIIRCKNGYYKENVGHDYYIEKGNIADKKEGHVIVKEIEYRDKPINDKVLTYTEVLKLQTDLVRLQLENEGLKSKLEDLSAYVLSLQEDEDEATGLNEKTPVMSMIEQLVSQVLPVADKYFSLQERSVAVKEKELQMRDRPRSDRPHVNDSPSIVSQWNSMNDEQKAVFWKELEELSSTNPAEYHRIYLELYQNNLI